MEINIDEFKKTGQQYVDTLVETLKEKAWEQIKSTKFQNSTVEELEVMKAIWSHGFMRGAETATEISMTLYDALNKKGK